MSEASKPIIDQGTGNLDSEKSKDIRSSNIIAARGMDSDNVNQTINAYLYSCC